MTEDDRKKAALIRLQKLLPTFGRKLDRNTATLRAAPHRSPFVDLANEIAKLLGPSAKA